MKTLKLIGIFLAVLLALFMIKGMILGAMFFFYVLRLIIIAAIIAGGIYLLKLKSNENRYICWKF